MAPADTPVVTREASDAELSRNFMVRMDEASYQRMRSAAFRAEMSMSAYARRAIERAVERSMEGEG